MMPPRPDASSPCRLAGILLLLLSVSCGKPPGPGGPPEGMAMPVVAARVQRASLEERIPLVGQAEEALRLARASFDAGAATQLEVLQSQLELSRSRYEQIEARHVYHSALARLHRAIGAAD